MTRATFVRLAGAVAAAVTVCAVGSLVIAAGGRFDGYVSEAGAVGAPTRGLYRTGIFGLAVATGLLGSALAALAARPTGQARDTRNAAPARRTARGSRIRWVGALTLMSATPFAFVSGTVSCSPGCPLPPYESPTQADIVHALASIAGLGLAALTMLAFALPEAGVAGIDRRLRVVSRVCAGLTLPPLAATGLGLLVLGRSTLTASLERLALVLAVGWLLAVALALATNRPPAGRP